MTFSFDDTIALPFGTLAKQEAGILLAIQQEAIAQLGAARRAYDKISAVLVYKYGQQARAERLALGKEAGAVQFDDNGVRFTVEQPRRIEWNQAQLADTVARMTAQGVDPTEFVQVRYSVDDATFQAWSPSLQASFAPARKVIYEPMLFTLTLLPDPVEVTS